MKEQFEKALQGLLDFKPVDQNSAAQYNDLFKQMIAASMQICGETDFDAIIAEKTAAAESKFGVKVEFSEEATDAYKKLRELVRFEMFHESVAEGREHEVCCTESNFENAVAKFRHELDKIVPDSQKEVLDSMCYSLYSDFTKFLVCSAFDMVADAKIYEMPEFRPLQLNAMGKELRTNVNVIKQQNAKPQKSQVVTDWFRTMMILPSFLFRKLYGVSLTEMFEVPQKMADSAAHMFNIFQKDYEQFVVGDEYWILKEFLNEMDLNDCFTVRPKVKKPTNGPVVN